VHVRARARTATATATVSITVTTNQGRTDVVGDEIAKKGLTSAKTRSRSTVPQRNNALEAQSEEVSREACCHRSGQSGIAALCSCRGRHHPEGSEGSDAIDPEVAGRNEGPVAGDRRDVGRSVPDRRRSPDSGARGPSGPGDAREATRSRVAECEERSQGRTGTERGFVQDRSAFGARGSSSRRAVLERR
jgi:hypothetical protein